MNTYPTQCITSNVHVWRTSKNINDLYLYGSVAMLILGCDCGVCVFNTLEAKIVK